MSSTLKQNLPMFIEIAILLITIAVVAGRYYSVKRKSEVTIAGKGYLVVIGVAIFAIVIDLVFYMFEATSTSIIVYVMIVYYLVSDVLFMGFTEDSVSTMFGTYDISNIQDIRAVEHSWNQNLMNIEIVLKDARVKRLTYKKSEEMSLRIANLSKKVLA